MRLSFSSPDRKVVILITSLPALRSVTGDLTKLDPIRPSQLLASSLPRRGAEIKMTRPISGRCWKMSASEKSFLLSGERGTCSGRFLKKLHPELVAGIGDEQAGDAASHAVADHDHLLAQWEALFDSVQFMPKDCRGIGTRDSHSGSCKTRTGSCAGSPRILGVG
jgi:hypothetical protein